MTIFDDNFWWQFLMTIFDDNFWWKFLMTISDDNFWWQFLMTISDDNFWWQFLKTIFMTFFYDNFLWQFLKFFDNFGNFGQFLIIFDNWDNWDNFWQFWKDSPWDIDIWDTDYSSDNWKPEFMTIFVTFLRCFLAHRAVLINNKCPVSVVLVLAFNQNVVSCLFFLSCFSSEGIPTVWSSQWYLWRPDPASRDILGKTRQRGIPNGENTRTARPLRQ